jgi:hypothetical protein
MTIACLGWGSLIWNPGDLPLRGGWREDGPAMPIEFVRQSNNGRITLCISQKAALVTVLWAELAISSLDEARDVLALREGISAKNASRLIGTSQSSPPQQVAAWAKAKNLTGVVWTALGPKFPGTAGDPSCEQVIAYLRGLASPTRELAQEYIRKTPLQIRTAYRERIEQALGWTPLEPAMAG